MFFCQYRIPIKSIRYHANRNKEKYTKQKRGIYTHQSQEQNQKPPKKDSIIPYIIFGSLFVLYDTYRRNRTYLSKRYK